MNIKTVERPALKSMNLKLSHAEYIEIKKMADKYAKGNVSAWLRYAGTHFLPSASDLSTEDRGK